MTAREQRIKDLSLTIRSHRKVGNNYMANIMWHRCMRFERMTDEQYEKFVADERAASVKVA